MATKRIRNGVEDRLLSDRTPHQMPKAAGGMEKTAKAVRRPLAVGVVMMISLPMRSLFLADIYHCSY